MRKGRQEEKQNITYTLKLRLEKERTFFGPGVACLLLGIDASHSINIAAKEMHMAYSKAWRILKEAEQALGFPLVVRKIGGADGGGSELTTEGRMLAKNYFLFEKEAYRLTEALFCECFAFLLPPERRGKDAETTAYRA